MRVRQVDLFDPELFEVLLKQINRLVAPARQGIAQEQPSPGGPYTDEITSRQWQVVVHANFLLPSTEYSVLATVPGDRKQTPSSRSRHRIEVVAMRPVHKVPTMPRTSSIRSFQSRKPYYTQYHGRQHLIAADDKDQPDGPTYRTATGPAGGSSRMNPSLR